MKFIFTLFILFSTSLSAVETILKNGAETDKLLKSGNFSWTAIHGNENDKHFEVDVYKTPGCTRLDMFFVFEDERQHMSTTHIFKDFWYVDENGKVGKYRPFEAPYSLATSYYYIMKSKVQVVNKGNLPYLGVLKSTENGTHKFSMAMSPAEKEAIRKRVELLKTKLIPSAQSRAEEKFYYRQAKKLVDYVKEGKINLVETNSGIVTRLNTPDGLVVIKNFQIVTIPDQDYLTPSAEAVDYTAPLDKENIIFLSHNEKWQPGMANFQTDGRILNLSTKSFRRIPFKGAVSTPQYYDSNSGKLYITGIPLGTNDVRPFTIDLNSGKQEPVGGSYFNRGQTFGLALSADKKLIAALHTLNPASKGRDLVVVDSQNRKIKRYPFTYLIGKVIWHPDNKSLFVNYYDETKKKSFIGSYTPGEKIEALFEGLDMVYLKDQKRLLYLDIDQKWKTADLDGKNSKIFGNGLQKLQYPALGKSPDKILMIKENDEKLPEPVIYDLNSNSSTKITNKKGLWLTPVWR